MANGHIVHLGIYGDVSNTILNNIQNINRSYVHYLSSYTTRIDRFRFNNLEFDRAVDNEIVAIIRIGMSDFKVRSWLASVVKGMAKMLTYGENDLSSSMNTHTVAIVKREGWNRKNDSLVSLTTADTIRMSDMYALYEVLKGRKMNWSKFTASDVKDRIAGRPFDPVRTEIETSYREQLAKIEAKFKKGTDDVEKTYGNACYAAFTERTNKLSALSDEKAAALSALEKEYAELRSANAGLSEQPEVQVA